jgi:hypothetical protein
LPAVIRQFFVVAALAAVGCKDKPSAEAAPSAESKPTASAASAEEMGTFICKDVQNDACIGPTDHFDASVPVVHVSYKTKDIPKNGDVYVIQWIAEDVGSAAPANTVISTLKKEVSDVSPAVKSYVANSRLTKPTAGWPVGKYRVEIKLGDKLVTTARFTIQ